MDRNILAGRQNYLLSDKQPKTKGPTGLLRLILPDLLSVEETHKPVAISMECSKALIDPAKAQ